MRYIPTVSPLPAEPPPRAEPPPPPRDPRSVRHSPAATARRTADLVNALADETAGPGDIAALLRAHGENDPVGLTPHDLAGLRQAAGRLREVFAAGTTTDAVTVLNRLLHEHTGPLRLTSHRGASPWHPHVDPDDDAPWPEWFLASSCLALAVLVWTHQRPPGGICAADGCPRVFVSQGSGRDRRYCSRRCATRERVAAHRRRHSPAQESGPSAHPHLQCCRKRSGT
ncbi:CGNR zinc finger domain-containing protein [Streptomyces sp. RG38]|uniref:CGNR zinc finger domain-containing protein n=1 Tax=Streptomyces tagetis TaxID=2820809 RepID=A0A941B098_9ACTN|nr:CGNR zinc finger domain-containing protein [Streptomyces sp. RG38]